MLTFSTVVLFVALRFLLLLTGPSSPVEAVPTPSASSPYWVNNIQRQGTAAFGDSSYQIYRNVQAFGAKG